MKCISCGSEIPEGSTSCPLCGNTVLPTNHNVVSAEAQMNTGVPVTPNAPVLPQDQNLGQNASSNGLEPAIEGEQNVAVQPSAQSVSSVQPVENMVAQNPDENVAPSPMEQPSSAVTSEVTTMGQNSGEVNGTMNAQNPQEQVLNQPEQGAMAGETVVGTPSPAPQGNAEMPMTGAPMVSNQGEMGDGMKITSTAAPVMEKKNNKKMIIIIAVVVAIIAIAAGVGIYYYMSQYKSADKRIDAVFSGMNKFAASLKAEKIEAKSGTFDLSLAFDYDTTSISGKIDGRYAYDLEKKIMDYGINISSLNMKNDGEDLELIDKEPLKLKLYTADAKAYVLLENFYENYIYSDIEQYDELFDGIEQNDINYTVILQGIINAIKSGLKATSNTQTVKQVTLDGKTQKANVVTIILNKDNQKKLTEKAVNSLKNNTKALEEMAKLANKTVDELKTSLDEKLKEVEYSDEAKTLEIITNTKGTALVGLRLYDDKGNMELASVTNGYKLSFKEDNKDVLNLSYTSTSTTNSTVEETSSKIELTAYDENDKLTKISLESNVKDDINPKVEKINTKNSVSANNISPADQQKILTNINNFGNLGLLFQSAFGGLIGQASTSTYSSTTVTPNGMTQAPGV